MNINEMTPEQIFLAENIVKEAEKSGINPNFALKLLFQESQFSPAAMGDNPEEVLDNIRTSMEMLKDLRESVGDDPAKIAAGFFAGGSGARFVETQDINDLPPEAVLSASDLLSSFGGNIPSIFTRSQDVADNQFMSEVPEDFGTLFQNQPKELSEPTIKEQQEEALRAKEEAAGRFYGGVLGAGVSGVKAGADVVNALRGRPTGLSAPSAASPSSNVGTMRIAPPTPAGALPGPGQVQANTPGQKWAQAVTGVVRPGTESVVEAASDYRRAMPSGKVSKPLAQKYGIGAPLDIGRIAAQNAPPAQGGLQAVTNMFQRMAQTPLGRAATTTGRAVSRYGLPPVTLALGAGEALSGIQEARKEKPDYVDVGLSGLGALGAGLSLFPATAPIGLPLAIGAPMLRQGLKRGAEPPPPSMDLMAP